MQRQLPQSRLIVPGLPPLAFPEALEYNGAIDFPQLPITAVEAADETQTEADQAVTTTPATIIENESTEQDQVPAKKHKDKQRAVMTPAPTSDSLDKALAEQRVHVDSQTQESSTWPKLTRLNASQMDESLNTQTSNIPEMKKALKTMMQPEHLTQGDTQIQIQAIPPRARSEISGSPARSNVSPSKMTELDSPVKGDKPLLSQSVAKQLESSKYTLRQRARQLAKASGSKKNNSDFVVCQCGCTDDEGDMVRGVHLSISTDMLTAYRSGQLCLLRYVAASALLRLHWRQ